jgi:putative transcriptional regulator
MNKLGESLIKSLEEALAHAEGKDKGRRARVHAVALKPADIQKARKKLGLSQDQFATAFGVSASTLRKWEQGQRSPTGAAETLLKIIDREPQAVLRALKAG